MSASAFLARAVRKKEAFFYRKVLLEGVMP